MAEMIGKRVLITGASRGIGADSARFFAEEGAKVGLLARDAGALAALAREIGPSARALPADVADFNAVAAAVAGMERAFGGIDILINNAGMIEPIVAMESADPAAWGRLIDINLKGAFHGIRAVLPGMIRQGGGIVITISSGAAHNPLEGWSAYCTSKAGAGMLTACLHHEAHLKGIRAMGLSPGTVATGMQEVIRASGVNPVSRLPASAHVPPRWVAEALLWMCGPAAEELAGREISLRDTAIRQRIGLTP